MAENASHFVRGNTWRVRVRLKDSSGTLIPLTGCTFLAQVRATPDSTDPLCTITVDGPDGDGWLSLSLTPAQTKDLRGSVYDLTVTFPSGDVTTFFPSRPLRVRKSASHV